jgi:hypothetical protein
MTSDRNKPGVAFWATVVVIVVLVAYPLSFGPWCWVTSRLNFGGQAIPRVYAPLMGILRNGPRPMIGWLNWYVSLGSDQRWRFSPRLDSWSIPDTMSLPPGIMRRPPGGRRVQYLPAQLRDSAEMKESAAAGDVK